MSKTEKINKKLNRPLNMVLGLSDNQLDLEDVKWEESIGWVGQMSGRKYKDMRDALNMVEAYDTLTPQQKDTAKHVARVLYYDSVYDKFQPIYYDGTPGLLDKNNKILDKKSISLEKLTNTDKSSQYAGRVVPSAVDGAKKALNLISTIDIKKLNEESLEAIKRFTFELDTCYDLIRKLKHQLKLEKAKNGKRKKK